jgi:uncharacterized coiled-coil protein SlyX
LRRKLRILVNRLLKNDNSQLADQPRCYER